MLNTLYMALIKIAKLLFSKIRKIKFNGEYRDHTRFDGVHPTLPQHSINHPTAKPYTDMAGMPFNSEVKLPNPRSFDDPSRWMGS